MILYHGSNVQIDAIELWRCNRFKDFGQAFYLSADINQAEEIAQTRADFLGGSPIVNSFLNTLEVKHFNMLSVLNVPLNIYTSYENAYYTGTVPLYGRRYHGRTHTVSCRT